MGNKTFVKITTKCKKNHLDLLIAHYKMQVTLFHRNQKLYKIFEENLWENGFPEFIGKIKERSLTNRK